LQQQLHHGGVIPFGCLVEGRDTLAVCGGAGSAAQDEEANHTPVPLEDCQVHCCVTIRGAGMDVSSSIHQVLHHHQVPILRCCMEGCTPMRPMDGKWRGALLEQLLHLSTATVRGCIQQLRLS
jgi:hypothetical protein